jgi:hypothetical protein
MVPKFLVSIEEASLRCCTKCAEQESRLFLLSWVLFDTPYLLHLAPLNGLRFTVIVPFSSLRLDLVVISLF